MIIIPVIGIIILFFTLANWSLNKKGIRVVMLILSVILILVGPVNHTLVRSPFNVFRPVGRIVTERVGDKRVEKIAPYKHTAFDKAVIKVFNLEEKGKKIAKWAKIEYQELPLTED